MVNLLFNYPNQSFSESNTDLLSSKQPSVIEVVTFEVKSKYSKLEVKESLDIINDIIKLYPGFVKRITAHADVGQYIDIVHWTDIQFAKEAAYEVMREEKAIDAFKVINQETIKICYYDIINLLEE